MENSEQLVGIKVARLLKVLGFDWEVTSCYNDNPDLKEDSKIEKKIKFHKIIMLFVNFKLFHFQLKV